MKSNYKKTYLKGVAAALALFVVVGFAGFTNAKGKFSRHLNSSKAQTNSVAKINRTSYVDKNVKVYYPQIANLSNNLKQKNINTIIKNDVMRLVNLYRSYKEEFSLNLDYVINRNDAKVLSIKYSGLGNLKASAHPTNEFLTTTIDMSRGSKLKLSDIAIINQVLVKKIRQGNYVTFSKVTAEMKAAINTYLGTLSDADILRMLKSSDSVEPEAYSYLTNDSLGISLTAIHAMGDHAEFEIKLKDLGGNIKGYVK